MTNNIDKQKSIEVELRGPISKEDIKKIEQFFSQNGVLKAIKDRVLIDYTTEGIEERKKDIRLRATNGISEIIIKLGKWGGEETRKEISVITGKGEFDKLVQVFGIIGLIKGVLCVRKSKVYDYKGIEFAFVEVPNHSFYFEAEKLIGDNDSKESAIKEIREVCQELNLSLFGEEEFFNYVQILNNEVNEIFDFNNYHENYFKDRFGI